MITEESSILSTKKASVVTLGCKVNQYESGAIAGALSGIGFDAATTFTFADLYIINTCSVTAEADKKSRQAIARVLKINPDASVIVVGCSSQNDKTEYENKPQVIAVFGTSGKIENILIAAKQFLEGENKLKDNTQKIAQKPQKFFIGTGNTPLTSKDNAPYIYNESKNTCSLDEKGKNHIDFGCFDTAKVYEDDMQPVITKTRGYLKIQDGCDSFCAYCRVPYLRGRSRSRSIESIIEEKDRLSRSVKEIVFTGVDISAYGKDIGTNLYQLIKKLNMTVRGRLSSLECNVIDEDMLKALKDAGFCDHFHLSLQSGSDTVLKRMNRRYTSAQFLSKVDLIRKHFPYAGITTDVIAGFSGETLDEHKQTISFINAARFSDIHVFPFSPRKGTKAYGLEQLDKSVRQERAKEISLVKNRLKKEFLKQNLGRTLEVYAEEFEDGYATGFTSNYIKAYTFLECGQLSPQKLTKLFKQGVLCDE